MMKLFDLLVVICGLNIAASELQILHRGSSELHFASESPKKTQLVRFNMCLKSVPIFVNATARAKDQSLPHKFRLNVIEIFIHAFVFELERTDQSAGWNEDLVVDWTIYSGSGGIVCENVYIWMLVPLKTIKQNRGTADNSCKVYGAGLIDIVDKEMYDAVYNYVKSTIIASGVRSSRIWLGINYNPTTKVTTTSSGGPAYNGNWLFGGFVSNIHYDTGVIMKVETDPRNPEIGLMNYRPERSTTVHTLCAIKL